MWYSSRPGEALEQQSPARPWPRSARRSCRARQRARARRSATRARRRAPARSRARRCRTRSRSAARSRTRSPAGAPSRSRPRPRPAQHAWSARTPRCETPRRRRAAATRPGRAGSRRDRRTGNASRRDRSSAAYWPRLRIVGGPRRETEPWERCSRPAATDERLVHERFLRGALRAPGCPIPGRARPARRRRRWPRPGSTQLYAHQARRARRGVRGPDDRHDRHRLGQVAVLPAADARGPDHRPDRPRPVPLPDQGARPGPGARAPRVRAAPSDPAGDLRRRHAARRSARRSASAAT